MVFAYFLSGILLFLLVIVAVLPGHMHVQSTVQVKASAEIPFELVNELKNWSEWSTLHKIDANWKITYSDPSTGKQAFFVWHSDHPQLGDGKLTLTAVKQNLEIIQCFESEKWGTNKALMLFTEKDGFTTISWQMEKHFKGWMKIKGLSMKGHFTRIFEEGLAAIQVIVEE